MHLSNVLRRRYNSIAEPAGVPRGLTGTAFPFSYNRLGELKAIVSTHKNELAAIVMEPVRNDEPEESFLKTIREIATATGSVLIFDEVTSGWRLNVGGAHLLYRVTPDMAVFTKAMSNGYPMAAIIRVGDVMEAAQNSFISSTHWTERIGPVAALATIRKVQRCDVPKHLNEVGRRIQSGWRAAGVRAGLSIDINGIPPLSHLSFDHANNQEIRTLFTQMMLRKGFLATDAFYATYAHKESHIEDYLRAVDETFALIARAIEKGEVKKLLSGPPAHSGFRRLALV